MDTRDFYTEDKLVRNVKKTCDKSRNTKRGLFALLRLRDSHRDFPHLCVVSNDLLGLLRKGDFLGDNQFC